MASPQSIDALPTPDRTDRPAAGLAQDDLTAAAVGARPSGLRLRTLVNLRWVVVAGQAGLLSMMGVGFGLDAPYAVCFAVVGLAAWINLLIAVSTPGQREVSDGEAVAQLGFDILQIAVLIGLTGGSANPFMVMLIAPVTLAAATLPLRPLLLVGAMAAASSLILAAVAMPLPTLPGALGMLSGMLQSAPRYRWGCAIANVVGMALAASYVRQAALEAARMALALDVTQTVLSREQRLSALGALAAAAAHELGTPLATIQIVAKELAREAAEPQVKEDAELLVAQAQRCREILQRLTATPDASDEVHERMSLRQLVQEVIEPHMGVEGVRVEAIVTGASGARAPQVLRRPEILHALSSYVENAVDFAAGEVLVTARFDAEWLSIEVRDDGPGFAPEILAKLGEPYVTTRPGAEGSRTGHVGMGLGFFIAKTLLERTGAVVAFQNGRPRGAVVSARWPRGRVEVEG